MGVSVGRGGQYYPPDFCSFVVFPRKLFWCKGTTFFHGCSFL